MSFVGLHVHSDYSLLDGASQLPQLVDRAAELGMPAIALTDHGVMYGAIELIKVCLGKPVKPIIGNEMYVVNGDIEKKEKGRKRYHQVVLAKNTQGYKNLVKLTTISHLQGFHIRPCVNKELLKQYREGLIVTSACLGGEVPQAILQGKLDVARRVAKEYKNVFGEDYYLEIQDHGSQEDRVVNVEIVKIARELDIKIVATNDSHFISCNDVEAHDALLCIQTGRLISEDNRMRYSGTEYLKSAKEMAQLFRDHLPDEIIRCAIANTLEVADKIQQYNILGKPRLPNYPVPPDHTADTYVEEKTWQGLRERLNAKSNAEIKPVYKERLEYELKMIQQMGFSTYFLVVWDYINYARKEGIPVGPGRGSAAGSLVAYSLQITNIDPVHHGLLFERFLNPERKSMPDIDTDFCVERRDDVIKYVTERYGKERVAQIITFNRLTSKSVLKDVARVLNIPYGDADKMAKSIPVSRGKPEKLAVMISNETPEPEFKRAYENDEIKVKNPDGTEVSVPVRRWVDMAMRVEGTNKTFGVHAAGIVISAQPLDEIVPLQKNNEGSVITQYSMDELESLGLLKMDFLGLKNLTMIQKTVDLVQKTQNIQIKPDDITAEERRVQEILAKGEVKQPKLEVKKTYDILVKADLEGIFQLESSGMRDVVQKLKPSSIEDISAILALYRPGPLDAGLIPDYINRKHGREPIRYDHPYLEPILQETYAVLVYQEQIMKIAQDLAGYSLGQADILRRCMGKKKADEMEKQRQTFLDGSAKNGVKRSVAEKLFDQMVNFAEYCFNKSHSTAYGYVTYQTAYLKANYPVEYMAALLTANSDDQDKVQKYLANCLSMGIQVEPPDINRSEVDFTPAQGKILFGLSAVRNLGEAAIECILTARHEEGDFKCLADLCDRVNLRTVNSRALEALICCGALDRLHPNRKQSIADLPLTIDWAQSRAKDRDSGQGSIFDLLGMAAASDRAAPAFESAPKATAVEDFSSAEKLQKEKELLGFYVSAHPLKSASQAAQILTAINLNGIDEQKQKAPVSVIVMLNSLKKVITKNGDPMAILQIEDLTAAAEAVVFPKTYSNINSLLEPDALLIIWGKVDKREEQSQLIVEDAQALEKVQMVTLELAPQQAVSRSEQQRLQEILAGQRGSSDSARVPAIAIVSSQNSRKCLRLLPKDWVQDCQAAVNALNNAGFRARVSPLTGG